MANSDMNYEQNRLSTFANWPSTVVDPGRIARAGFYATGEGVEVICHWCQKKILDWKIGDQAIKRHREMNQQCPFVLNTTECGNIPIQNIAESHRQSTTADAAIVNSNDTNSGEIEVGIPVDLKNEQYRLSTFRNWPLTYISPASLAKAGFYYFDSVDRVKCAWCDIIVGQWEIGDNPFSEHQRLFPNCPKVQLGPNIEIASDGIRELGIQQIKSPKEPRFSSLDARMRTFYNWPRSEVHKPEDLAEAGFYYQGVADQVRCFHCNGGLRYWLPGDDPWFEHGRWFPKCQFIQLVKGHQYIKDVQDQAQNEGVIREPQTPSISLDEAMSTENVQLVLQMGLNEGRIRSAVKTRLEKTGKLFQHAEQLIEAVLDGQFDEEEPTDITSRPIRLPDSRQNHFEFESVDLPTSNSIASLDMFPKMENLQQVIKKNTQSLENKTNNKCIEENTVDESQLSLEEENRKLKDARLCKVCMDGEVGVVFLPCGHLVTCVQCAPGVTMCPLCRSSIKGFVRTFLS